MVWINDIWFYFLDEYDIPIAYLNSNNGLIYMENNDDFLQIPKPFKRTELLRMYVLSTNNKKLIKEIEQVSDYNLREYFHCKYSPFLIKIITHIPIG